MSPSIASLGAPVAGAPLPWPRLLALGLAVALAACGSEAPVEPAAPAPVTTADASAFADAGVVDVRVDPEAGTIRYRNDDGEVAVAGGAAAALPRDFPDDVFLPADYIVDSTLAMNRELFIGLGVREDVPSVYAAAREAMSAHGWSETLAVLENSDNGLLSFEKGDRGAILSFSRDGARTRMGLQLTHRVP